MNRQSAPPRAPSTSTPFRGPSANGMYYATAGQQATAPQSAAQAAAGQRAASMGLGQGAFPPAAGPLRGPPGFGGRGADPNDFPALGTLNMSHGSHMPSSTSYAAQAQPSSAAPTQSQQHLQQQLFMQQQQQQQQQQQGSSTGGVLGSGLVPPPPPGLAGPGASPSNQSNGLVGVGEASRGDDFPALAVDGKDGRLPALLKSGQSQATSPVSTMTSMTNGAPSMATGPGGSDGDANGAGAGGWGVRHSPPAPSELVVRPIQQIMSSPVDKWGLKALLYQIKMAEGDRAKLLFGDELNALGMDIAAEEPLYPTFVTPWAEPSQLHNVQIEESYQIPYCYHVNSQPIETKIPQVSEDTLFYMFYSSPQDLLQLQAAEELYNRGWRYHTELQVWMQSPALASLDVRKPETLQQHPAIRGPVIVFNPSMWARSKSADDFVCELGLLEATRSAAALMAEATARKEASKSPNGNGVGVGPAMAQAQAQAQAQGVIGGGGLAPQHAFAAAAR